MEIILISIILLRVSTVQFRNWRHSTNMMPILAPVLLWKIIVMTIVVQTIIFHEHYSPFLGVPFRDQEAQIITLVIAEHHQGVRVGLRTLLRVAPVVRL